MRTTCVLLAYAMAAATACTGVLPDGQPSPGGHPIDALLAPRLAALGLQPREASPEEYCRRLAIDLHGRIPDPGELADCVALPDAESRVDAAMASPRYERTMRRAWGEILRYNNFVGWSDEVVDLDELVGRLYRDEVRYDDFAVALAVHPGFMGLHRYDDWPAALWNVLLGRPARVDEIAAFRPLSNVFYPRFFCEGHIYVNILEALRAEGFSEADSLLYADEACMDFERVEWAVDFCLCDPDVSPGGCASGIIGLPVILSGRCPNPDEPDHRDNVQRLDVRVPGDDDTCPDGSHKPECADRETYSYYEGVPPLGPLPLIDDAGRAELAKIGRAFLARGDFWETAVDREARLLLGWWQTSFRQPDSDLPDVRRALVDIVKKGGSVREVQRLILTSQLYLAPAEPPAGLAERPGGEIPDFVMAPTKLMAAETWLDSAADAVGEPTGVCDFRFVTSEGYYDTLLLDYRLAEPPADSIYDSRFYEEAYYDFAIRLGGCNAETRRPSLSNVGMAFAEGELSRALCAYGRDVLPTGWNGDLDQAARHVISRILGRSLDETEAARLVEDMQACRAAGADTGCADDETAVRWLCQRALESVEFSTY